MFRNLVAGSCFLLALAALGVRPVAAEETNHLWPRFAVDAGAYEISISDKIRVQGVVELGNADIDLSRDIGLPDTETLLSLKLDWAFAERHSIEFG